MSYGSLDLAFLFYTDSMIDGKVNKCPQDDVHYQQDIDVQEVHQPQVHSDKEQRNQQDAHHRAPNPKSSTYQFVVDMVLVRQERVLMVAQPVEDHSSDIQQRHEQRGEGDDHIRRFRFPLRGVSCTQMDDQYTEDISQSQASCIAHEQLVSPASISEHVIEPERYQYSQGGQGQYDIDKFTTEGIHDRQYDKSDAAQSRCQPVNAVYQVDGIGDVDDDEYRNRHTDSRRKGMYAEQSTERVELFSRKSQEECCNNLTEKLVPVAYTNQVIRHTYQIKKHTAHREEAERVDHTD